MTELKNMLKIALVKTYTEEVAKRLDVARWTLAPKWENQAERTVVWCIDREIATVDKTIVFVKAQFYTFTVALCKKLFGLKYPPLGVFNTEPGYKRYHRYVNSQFNAKSKEKLDIPALVKSEFGRSNCSKSGRVDTDKLKLCIMNGSVSPYTVAFLFIKFKFSNELCREVAHVVNACREENLFDKYKEIQTLIEKGELDAK